MDFSSDLVSVLKSIPWFLELTPEQLDRLAAIGRIRVLQQGELVFDEGDRADNLYVVLEGQVTIQCRVPTRGSVRIFTAEPLDVIGWSSLTPVIRQRNSSACATRSGRLLCFDSEALRNLCDEDHDLGYLIMKRISNVIGSRLLATKLQLMDLVIQENAALEKSLVNLQSRL